MSEISTIAKTFTRLSVGAFGGPAAHVAMMNEEFVRKRHWLSQEKFLSLVAATQLIPGPNSTELAMHIGYLRAGWKGLLVAGAAFICPAALIVAGAAWFYQTYGQLPWLEAVFAGLRPVIVAIIGQALWSFGRDTLKSRKEMILFVAFLAAIFAGVGEIAIVGAGLVAGLIEYYWSIRGRFRQGTLGGIEPIGLSVLFLAFAKVGSVLFGSGYVLVAFLRSELVEHRQWISERLLLDAIAIGQMTPGPVFTTATFIGWMLSGPAGALAATVGIFLPAFAFVALSVPLLNRLQTSQLFKSVLRGVLVASLAAMASVIPKLANGFSDAPWQLAVAGGAWIGLTFFKLPSQWLLATAGALALARFLL